VYWYDRVEDSLRRLWLPDKRDQVTRVALVDTVELMVAAGTGSGAIVLFQVMDMGVFKRIFNSIFTIFYCLYFNIKLGLYLLIINKAIS